MKVSLLTSTPNATRMMWVAYRTCYSKDSPQQLWERTNEMADEEIEKFLARMFETEHTSPQRHIYFGFGITDVSRALSHQLVRHVVGVSHSQQSQRYVDGEFFNSIEPPSILKNENAHKDFQSELHESKYAYQRLQELGVENEDARFILPNATSTCLVSTFSYEALRNFCNKRLCSQAQWEIKELARAMKKEVAAISPFLSSYLGPTCAPKCKGMCSEPYNKYLKCKSGRPHKTGLLATWAAQRACEKSIEAIEDYPPEGC